MTAVTLDKLEMHRRAATPIYQHLAEHIIAKINSGTLISGDKLPTEHSMAKQLGVNRLTVRKSYQLLERQSLVERHRGMGTFVSDNAELVKNKKSDAESFLYCLIPYRNFFMSSDQSGIMAQRMYMGMCDALSLDKVKMIPVSQAATIDLEAVDYSALEQIPSGATVIIEGKWYQKLFPWLAERQVHGIYIADCEEQSFARKHNFSSLLINRSGAVEDAVCYLNSLGCKRIATLKCGEFEPDNPYIVGFINGLKRCALNYDPKLIKLFPTAEMFPAINQQYFKTIISELWSATKFDAIILSIPDVSTTALAVLQHELGLKVPDDVAVISLHDRIEHINSHLPITAIEFPWYDMGRECANLLESETDQGSSTRFNATLTERESTRKGAGSFVNSKILPECKLGAWS